MPANASEDNSKNYLQDSFMSAMEQPNLIRINLDIVIATITSVNGMIGKRIESSLKRLTYISLEISSNVMEQQNHIKINSVIVIVITTFVNGMIGNRKELFPLDLLIKLTSFIQDKSIAMLILNIRMNTDTVTAGITAEDKLFADIGNFVKRATKDAF